jgi:hypothetical protein
VLFVPQFDIAHNHVFVDEVGLVVQHNYFDRLDHLDHDCMKNDHNLQNQNYSFDHLLHCVVYQLVDLVDDNHFLHRNIVVVVVVDDNHHHDRHHVLSEMEEYSRLNVIDLDHHRRLRRRRRD